MSNYEGKLWRGAGGCELMYKKADREYFRVGCPYDVYAYAYAGEIAPLGQASTHVPQSAQVSGSIV